MLQSSIATKLDPTTQLQIALFLAVHRINTFHYRVSPMFESGFDLIKYHITLLNCNRSRRQGRHYQNMSPLQGLGFNGIDFSTKIPLLAELRPKSRIAMSRCSSHRLDATSESAALLGGARLLASRLVNLKKMGGGAPPPYQISRYAKRLASSLAPPAKKFRATCF
jgi:hypothetical protein